MKNFSYIFACCLIIVLTTTSAFAQQQTKRIWCIGDSITLGKSADDDGDGVHDPYPTYRKGLREKLTGAGWDVDFVGTLTGFSAGWSTATCLATYPEWQDQQHEGWNGYCSSWILNGYGSFAGVDDVAATVNPDIVLLHIGTNDENKGMTFEQSQASIVGIINAIRVANPNTKFYVAAIIPEAERIVYHQRIEQLSAWIANNIETYSTEASPVYMVDMHTGYDNVNWYVMQGDTNDGVHPDHRGEAFMADQWFDALQETHAPEPATLSVLGLGGLAMLRRRRN